MLRALLFLLGSALLAPVLPAQVTVLDEGTFTHVLNGVRVGREDFSIRATRGGGAAYVAQANVLAGERRRTVVVNADSAGGPLRFQLETREATALTERVVGERQRSLWLGRILSERRESGREFRLPDRTVIVEPGVAHHLWFLLQFGLGSPAVLLSPSGPTQDTVAVAELAPDSVAIGPAVVAARHWAVRGLRDGTVRWEAWTDRGGRLLRVRHVPSGLDALRDDPPAETVAR